MSVTDLPTLNATLNSITAILLMYGFVLIKSGQKEKHKKIMISALVSSALFLTSYLFYHYSVGSIPYQRYDWTRTLYFAILIPHTILAVGMLPFIFVAVWRALHDQFDRHKRIVRWLWPVWMYVSVTGVVVYFMLYHVSG